MKFQSSIVLPDDKDKAADQYEALVAEVGLGLSTVLREDSKDAFDQLTDLADDERFKVTVVWAPTQNSIDAVKAVLDRLPNGDKVNYDILGHRVISVNKADVVSLVLSRVESQDDFEILRAFTCSAGRTVCGF